MNKNTRADVIGLDCDRWDLEGMLSQLELCIEKRSINRIVVINSGKIVKAKHDEELRNIINTAEFIGADGMSIVYASRLLGDPVDGRVNGTDLMDRFLEQGDKKNYRIYFFGARQNIVEKCVEIVNEKYPGVEIAGFRNGYFKPEDEAEIVENICASKADILFVAIPSPNKEYFINTYYKAMNVPVCHGVGGSFDVLAGLVDRAPVWMQKNGLEWLYRWYQEPRRMSYRNLVENPKFLWLLFVSIIKRRILRK